jgi:hypothetical protein
VIASGSRSVRVRAAGSALTGTKLVIGVTVNFILGALMTLGVGLYGLALGGPLAVLPPQTA